MRRHAPNFNQPRPRRRRVKQGRPRQPRGAKPRAQGRVTGNLRHGRGQFAQCIRCRVDRGRARHFRQAAMWRTDQGGAAGHRFQGCEPERLLPAAWHHHDGRARHGGEHRGVRLVAEHFHACCLRGNAEVTEKRSFRAAREKPVGAYHHGAPAGEAPPHGCEGSDEGVGAFVCYRAADEEHGFLAGFRRQPWR